jgi:hypothetical protein
MFHHVNPTVTAHRFQRLRIVIGILVALALCIPLGIPSVQAQSTPQLRVIRTDLNQFPVVEVTVQLRNKPINTLDESSEFSVLLNGETLDLIESRSARTPGATMIVTDLSSRMSERDAAGLSRFEVMQPLVSHLVSELQSSDQRAGLIAVTNEVRVVHSLTNDLGAIANTLGRSNTQFLFEAQPLEGADPTAAYPLDLAIIDALDQLADAPPEQLRTLVLFAAGDATRELNATAVRLALDNARSADRPVQLLVYSFNSDPAVSNQLRTLATDGQLTAVIMDGQIPSPELKREIFTQYANLIDRGALVTLRVAAPTASAGPAELVVRGADTEATVAVDVPALAPQVSLFVSDPAFQGIVQMAIRSDYQQESIAQVEYLLDGLPIATVDATQGPSFTYALNVDAAEFQQRTPPGTYELIAAVQDAQGQVSRSAPQSVEVIAAPPPPGPNWLPWLIGAGVVVLIMVPTAIFVARRKPRRTVARDDTPTKRPTASYDDDEDHTLPVQSPDNDATAMVDFDDEKTAPVDFTTIHTHTHWKIVVVSGDTAAPLELKSSQRNYDIGRKSRDRTPHLALSNKLVSRDHAQIELLANGPTLIAGSSTHGTFFGAEKRAMAPGERHALQDNDIFWLSAEVQLQVKRETES